MLMATLCGCAHQPTASVSSAPAEPETSHYLTDALTAERLVVGAQPLQIDLVAARSAGVGSVINLRTPEEMAELDFDEAAEVSALGMTYLALPIGGKDHPFTPALVDALDAQIRASNGNVLLHCAGGGRAGLVYAAWLVKYRGQTPDAAMRTLEALGGWPLPLEKLLGRPLRVDFQAAE